MSFFKKMLGREELTPEEQQKRLEESRRKQAEKEKVREAAKIEAEKLREERRIEKQRKQAEQLKRVERFFGPNPGFSSKTAYFAYQDTFEYLQDILLSPDENVLALIQAEFDKTQKREIKGLLVATDIRLIFAFVRGHNQYIEEFSYSKMQGISLKSDGFTQKELYIDYNRGRKKFDDILDTKEFKIFLDVVRKQIAAHTGGQRSTKVKQQTSNENKDKYAQLERVASLRDQGILSEEEFQQEKQKILNS